MTARSGPVAGDRRPSSSARAHATPSAGPPPYTVDSDTPGGDPVDWVRAHVGEARTLLDLHGALRLRGFGTRPGAPAELVRVLAGEPEAYRERSSPRTEVAPGVYTSTEHPADQEIALHNECSYRDSFPTLLAFHCLRPATWGGDTPLADCRRVLERIPDRLVTAFTERGVGYRRTYHRGLGVSWQQAFGTDDRDEVGDICRGSDLDHEWRADGGLRTWAVRPAVATHPRTGHGTWLNHAAFFHVSGLSADLRRALSSQFAPEDLPAHTWFGDGAPIADEDMATIREAYAAESVSSSWRAGDVLLVDNVSTAHGRRAFGGRREVVLAMAAPTTWSDVTPDDPHAIGARAGRGEGAR